MYIHILSLSLSIALYIPITIVVEYSKDIQI